MSDQILRVTRKAQPDELKDFYDILVPKLDKSNIVDEVGLYDNWGKVLPKTKWESLRQKIDIFYASRSDRSIHEYNRKVQKDIDEMVARNTNKYRGKGQGTTKETKDEKNEGFVYLMQGGGYYKIGKSTAPIKRYEHLEVKLPFEVEIIHKVKTDQYSRLENFLHEKFLDKRTNGEWFDLDEEDVEYIRSLNGDEYE